MPVPLLIYSENIRDHQNIGDDLGLLQGGIVKGRITNVTPNAFFVGYELIEKPYELLPVPNTYYLKKDLVSTGKNDGKFGRATRRVIVRVNNNSTLVEDFALIWNHQDGFKQLNAGFFTRAKTMRNI